MYLKFSNSFLSFLNAIKNYGSLLDKKDKKKNFLHVCFNNYWNIIRNVKHWYYFSHDPNNFKRKFY